MSPAPVCTRVTLTIEVSEVLFSAIQITATMAQTTVNAFIGTALRQTQITFFAEAAGTSESDVAVLDVRATRPLGTKKNHGGSAEVSGQRGGDLGSLQQAIMNHLLDTPTMSGIYDLFEVRKTMLRTHSGPAVSRAVHQFVRRGLLEPMTAVGTGFQPDVDRSESRLLRYVRLGAGS